MWQLIKRQVMKYYSRRFIKPEHLNPANLLFGGQLLSWIDEEAAIFAGCQMKTQQLVTKLISEINFMTPGRQGDVIEFGLELVSAGSSSITVRCEVRSKVSHLPIVIINKMVFVNVDEKGLPAPHGLRANAA
ncbi:MAG: acyl-CoA hydrolase [Shewanella sp.]|jgi:acyl-CoA hydrolase